MITCNAWEYDLSKFSQTLASEFDLVCGREKLLSIGQTVYFFGMLCSGPMFGILSDRFGRKPMLIAAILMMSMSGLGSGLIPNFEVFLVFRFFTAMGEVGKHLKCFKKSYIPNSRHYCFSGVYAWNYIYVRALWQQLDHICRIGFLGILGNRLAFPWGPCLCLHQLATSNHGYLCPWINSCFYLLLHPVGITQVAPVSGQI